MEEFRRGRWLGGRGEVEEGVEGINGDGGKNKIKNKLINKQHSVCPQMAYCPPGKM